MKKMFGILMLVVTLLSGIAVMAQDNDKHKMAPNTGHGSRHHHRHHHHRHGRVNGNKNKH